MVFYIFNYISVNIEPNNMFLGALHLENEKTTPQVWSFAVLVQSSYSLFPVLRSDFQTLCMIDQNVEIELLHQYWPHLQGLTSS
jgi:hypothetical protein